MKRPNGVRLAVLLLAAGACSAPSDRAAESVEGVEGWVQTVAISGVQRRGDTVVVQGRAAAAARVVLRGPLGEAFAASADDAGAFELTMPAPEVSQLYRTEVQAGQDVARGIDWLFVGTASDRVLAVLTPGDASRRLDHRALIEAVDHDGRVMLASGRAQPGAAVELSVDGRLVATATAGTEGRWVANLGAQGQGPVRLRAGAGGLVQDVVYPGYPETRATDATSLNVAEASGGMTVIWAGPGGARQTAWFPHRVATAR